MRFPPLCWFSEAGCGNSEDVSTETPSEILSADRRLRLSPLPRATPKRSDGDRGGRALMTIRVQTSEFIVRIRRPAGW